MVIIHDESKGAARREALPWDQAISGRATVVRTVPYAPSAFWVVEAIFNAGPSPGGVDAPRGSSLRHAPTPTPTQPLHVR